MPGPACSTSMGEEQPVETLDKSSVMCRGTAPYFMAELVPGSYVYFRAYVTVQQTEQLKLKFPGISVDLCDTVCQLSVAAQHAFCKVQS